MRKSFTSQHKFLGGVPIYVDEEFKDKVIPKGTQQVEKAIEDLTN